MTDRIISAGFNTGDVGGDLDLLARKIDHMAALGADGCEITAISLDAVVACRLVPHRVAALREVVAARPMAYSLHAPIAVNLMDLAHLDLQKRACRASLELAGEIGAKVVVVHPGRCHPRDWAHRAEALLAAEREALAEMVEAARGFGVRIAYENMSPNRHVIAGEETSYALDPRALAAQLDAVGAPELIACLDVSHAQQGAVLMGFDMIEASAALSPHLGHIHFSDSTGVPATMRWDREGERHFFGVGDMHAPPGWGAVDFDGLAATLNVLEDTRIVIELKANYRAHAERETLDAARAFGARIEGANR